MVLNAKKPSQPGSSAAGSSDSMPRNRDMNCHTCGGRGNFKRDCPNRKVMLINEETVEYETGDNGDPESDCCQDDEDGSLDAYATHLPTIVCSPNVSHRSHRIQKHKFSVTCPGTLFMKIASGPPEH
jgi:hypothetical protein